LNDCLSDVAVGDYGVQTDAAGLVLVLSNFEVFADAEPRVAHDLLDVFATQARGAALVGRRMMCLVQSNDPRLTFRPIGATPVLWNDKERLDRNRGL
jgi:hypothetical protein